MTVLLNFQNYILELISFFFFLFLCLEGSAVSGSGRSGKPQAKSRDGKCSISAFFFPLVVLQSSNVQSSFKQWISSKYSEVNSK